MNALTFNPDLHEYRLDGRIIPSVTQVIETIQSWRGIPPDVLEHARVRGSKVDAAVNAYDEAYPRYHVAQIEDEIVPYLLAWKRFREDTKCEILESQLSGYNQVYGYAGTLDKILRINRKPMLTDLKATASIEPETALQTAGYSMLTVSGPFNFPRGNNRATLQLKPNATYRLHEWKDPSDFPTFLAALTLTNWAARNRR